jgi:geranylgeranyl diphosphate synthase type 3
MNLIESLPVSLSALTQFTAFSSLGVFLIASAVLSDHDTTAELLCLHRGQGLEILWRDSLQCPTEEEYVGMVNDS